MTNDTNVTMQAVCVTTLKVSWLKLLMCLISVVTRSNIHLVRETHIWLHKAISISWSRFGDDWMCDFRRPISCFSLRRFYVLFGAVFICIRSSQSERDLSVVHTWICIIRLLVMLIDFITGQGDSARTKSRVRNLALSVITILFSSTSTVNNYFANSACL